MFKQQQKSLWDFVNESKNEMNKSAESIAETIMVSTDFVNENSIMTFLDIISSLLSTSRFDVVDEILLKLPLTRISQCVHEEIKTLSNLKFTEARLLPKTRQSKTSQITQIVCNDSVYITLWIHPIYTIVIENDVIAKEYFDLYSILWGYSKKIPEAKGIIFLSD